MKKNKVFIIAEMSGNHNGDIKRAMQIIDAAADAGADAIKIQTYTADTMTLDCDTPLFRVGEKSIWSGKTFYQLYEEAHTPWEWHKELMEYATNKGIILFSSPFDFTAVDLLEEIGVPLYKIASFEINDIRLIRYVARKGKPILMSTGVATEEEIEAALEACREEGNDQVTLLKCTSAYPTPMQDVNLKAITYLRQKYGIPIGLSDHTLGSEVAIAAVALGATVVEKHFTLSRIDGGVDSTFSMEPHEFADMVKAIRHIEMALGNEGYALTEKQKQGRRAMRSIFIAKDVKKGECITQENIKSVRPSDGMNTRHWDEMIGRVFKSDYPKGTPLQTELME